MSQIPIGWLMKGAVCLAFHQKDMIVWFNFSDPDSQWDDHFYWKDWKGWRLFHRQPGNLMALQLKVCPASQDQSEKISVSLDLWDAYLTDSMIKQ